jgi:hypothetical protein
MFPLNHSNIADIKARELFDQNSRRTWASTMIAGATASALLTCAHTYADAAGSLTRSEREHHACAVVMGFPQPGELYDACVRSLDDSLSELDQEKLISTDRRACAKERLRPGTPAFANCVVDAEPAAADTRR